LIYEGCHLMVDAICKNVNLNDADLGNRILEKIVHVIDMTMILPPVTVKFPHAVCEMQRVLENLEKEGLKHSKTYQMISDSLHNRKMQTYGYSTMIMIAESHLSLHTFPEDDFITFDCYSCKKFDHELVLSLLNEKLNILNSNVSVVNRTMPKILQK